jgi:hypothetical protein
LERVLAKFPFAEKLTVMFSAEAPIGEALWKQFANKKRAKMTVWRRVKTGLAGRILRICSKLRRNAKRFRIFGKAAFLADKK